VLPVRPVVLVVPVALAAMVLPGVPVVGRARAMSVASVSRLSVLPVVPAVPAVPGLTPQVSAMAVPVVMPGPVAPVGSVVTVAATEPTPPVAVLVVPVGVQGPPVPVRRASLGRRRCVPVVLVVPAVRAVTLAMRATVVSVVRRRVGRSVWWAPRVLLPVVTLAVPVVAVVPGLTRQL
jgi:hypothetical protein